LLLPIPSFPDLAFEAVLLLPAVTAFERIRELECV
jgi:hypothetical protein